MHVKINPKISSQVVHKYKYVAYNTNQNNISSTPYMYNMHIDAETHRKYIYTFNFRDLEWHNELGYGG